MPLASKVIPGLVSGYTQFTQYLIFDDAYCAACATKSAQASSL